MKSNRASLRRLGKGENVYSNVMYAGRSLKDWQKALHFQYSLGELYRMATDGKDFQSTISK